MVKIKAGVLERGLQLSAANVVGYGSGEDRCSPAWLAVALPAARCPESAQPENL